MISCYVAMEMISWLPVLEFLDCLMLEEYEVKILPKLGPPGHGGECSEGTHLHRKLTWNRDGYTWEADGKYARLLTQELNTPASKEETGKNDRYAGTPRRNYRLRSLASVEGLLERRCI